MKRILLSALLAASLPALAQTEKGKIMVGVGLANVSAGFNHYGGEGLSYFNANISPTAGYFVSKNLALGTSVGLGWGKSGGSSAISYGVQPFARYYFGEKKTRLFVQADAGIHALRLFNNPGPTEKMSMVNFAAGPGITHFLNENVALETSLLLRASTPTQASAISYNPSLNFGFQIYLNGFKKKLAQPATAE